MAGLHNSVAGRTFGRFARFGLLRGLRSIEIDPEEFRRQLKKKHGLEVANFRYMHHVPLARLDAIAKILIRDTERLALLEGAGFGLGGMITIIPDAGLLTFLTLRLIQRLCLLYGFEQSAKTIGLPCGWLLPRRPGSITGKTSPKNKSSRNWLRVSPNGWP